MKITFVPTEKKNLAIFKGKHTVISTWTLDKT